jgi:DNA repair exonuclease SbcCD ATPase subunit
MMKRTYLTVTVLSLAAFVTGCEPANRTNDAERLQESAAEQFEEAQEATQDAIQAAGDYAEAQRTAFIAQMEQGLTALRNEADDLKIRVANATDDVKAEGQHKLDALKQQADRLEQQLSQLRDAPESSWESLKDGFETAYHETRQAFNDTREWLSEKIAPDQG